jgi:hypothetical protein
MNTKLTLIYLLVEKSQRLKVSFILQYKIYVNAVYTLFNMQAKIICP